MGKIIEYLPNPGHFGGRKGELGRGSSWTKMTARDRDG